MSTEIQTKITADASGAIKGLTDAAAAVDRLKRKTEEANKAAKDYQQNLKRTTGDAAKGLSVAGGAGGMVGGKIAAIGSLEGGFARAAIAVGVAAVAFKALSAVIDQRIAKERALVESQQRLADIDRSASQSGQASREASARAGLDRLDNLRGFIAEGGDMNEASRLAAQNIVDIEDAAAFLRERDRSFADGKQRNTATNAAGILAQTGKMPFGSTLQALLQNPVALAAIGNGDALTAATSVANAHENRGPDNFLTPAAMAEQMRRVSYDDGLSEVLKESKANIRGQLFEIKQATADGGRVAAAALWAKLNPELAASTKALIELNAEQAKQVEMLQRLAAAQGSFLAVIENAKMLVGGDGSYQQQLNRAQGVRADATFMPRVGRAIMGGL